ncbi:MAG: response regulator [Betaproteobacteria bacterium]|nr:response regulator [Betaproteobacteria bacterium]
MAHRLRAVDLTIAQLQGILSIADDAVVCFDNELRIILFNLGAERIFGWSAAEAIGQTIDLLLPPRFRPGHGKLVQGFRESGAIARKMGERSSISGMRRDGSEFPAEASISRLEAEDSVIFTVILRDITARVEHERELQAAKEKAEAAMQAKSMFLANMSHEIRTPLNAVIGMTSLLLNTQIDDEQRDYAETVRASSEALLTIINDILDYSKIEVGKLEIERFPFDLRRCLEEAMDLISAEAGEKNINLAYFLDDSVPASLVGDVTRLRQVLVNLLSNAIKFTHRGEVVITVSGTALDDRRHEISFAVRDTGIGIAEDQLATLFQSFTQGDASTTRKYGGTGLGLAISRRLTEMMGGRMWVDSQVGSGSTFHFTVVAEAAGSQLANSYLQEYSSALAGKRVLIVDDNSTNRRILVKQALIWGMLPSAAASGIEALDFIRHGHAFDVGILDMSMPEMDGLALALEIRKHRDAQALPLVMLTSLANQRTKDDKMGRAAFAAYINKPIKPAALLDVLLHAMRVAPMVAEVSPPVPVATRLADSLPLDILVAEDNTVNQKVVQQLLAHLGYRADVVASGIEVLDALDRQNYDVILMDVQMPDMDGLEATRRLKLRFGREAAPKVIAMTASAMLGDREKCLAAGMDAYVSKPVELDQIRAVLTAVCQGRVTTPSSANENPSDETPVIDRRRIEQLRDLQDAQQPRMLAELIAMFLADSPEHLQQLTAAIHRGDPARLADLAHRYLSSVENLGARRMRGHCMELERMGRAGSVAGADRILEQLQRELALACETLAEIAAQQN